MEKLSGPDYLSVIIEWPPDEPVMDRVAEASDESFPASDPPGWGSSHAAPTADTVCADIDALFEKKSPEPAHTFVSRLKAIGVALAALGSLFALVAKVRRMRAHA